MTCAEAKKLFSPYLDGVLTGAQMQKLDRHVEECVACQGVYREVRKTQMLLAGLEKKLAPADLGLKLRVMASQEAARVRRPRFEGVRVRLGNAINAVMVPASAGLASAVVIFGLMMQFFAVPQLQANHDDVPLMLNTGPVLQQSAFGTSLSTISSDSLVIEAYVDENGRVWDYKILSDAKDAQAMLPQVKNMLIFTTFRPAMAMGRPTADRAVLSFSRVNVKG